MVTVELLSTSMLIAHSFASTCASREILENFHPRKTALAGCQSLRASEQENCKEGEKLFFDKRISFDGKVSCASCHELSRHSKHILSDGKARPMPRGYEAPLPRTPSLLDVGRSNGPFFWNGRAHSLEAQAFWPLYGKHELGASPRHLEKFGGAQKIAVSLASYVKTLQSGDAPFDNWLRGDCDALSESEARGAKLVLMEKSCTQCHQGSELRGSSPETLHYSSLPSSFFLAQEPSYSADAELAQVPGARHSPKLKTVAPSLRNLDAKGGPFGRFGQHYTLSKFLKVHGTQPVDPALRYLLSRTEELDVVNFLRHGLKSFELEAKPVNLSATFLFRAK